jgi:carotenoid 1,2-hydratase
VIGFVGSVFSPFYFRSRDRLATVPYDHCAMNVALYGSGRGTWAFTEYSQCSVQCNADSLVLGQNQIVWDGQGLTCHINERAAPLPMPIRGTVRIYPETSTNFVLALDSHSQHWWQPLVPRARIVVAMEKPLVEWSGTGYLDTNDGATPLDEGFRRWSWLRAHGSTGTTVIYDITPSGEIPRVHALKIDHSGRTHPFEPPQRVVLPKTGWRIQRDTHADFGFVPKVTTTLEDAPFYARSVLDTKLGGERLKAVHESLSLERFRSPWVRALLPFRMRRSRR